VHSRRRAKWSPRPRAEVIGDCAEVTGPFPRRSDRRRRHVEKVVELQVTRDRLEFLERVRGPSAAPVVCCQIKAMIDMIVNEPSPRLTDRLLDRIELLRQIKTASPLVEHGDDATYMSFRAFEPLDDIGMRCVHVVLSHRASHIPSRVMAQPDSVLCYREGEVIESKERPEGGAVGTTRPEGSEQQPGPGEPPSLQPRGSWARIGLLQR
jgi:hypothetical protein